MDPSSVIIPVSESIGTVSGLLEIPKSPRALVVLAHGAGAGMRHKFMESLAAALASKSIGTLRYNFPFTENRKGRPDPPAIAEKTVAAALRIANTLHPDIPVFAAGKSFGGRMSSHYLSKESPSFVEGIIFYGFPLHAPGKEGIERAAHLAAVKVPMLFLQGTRDALATFPLITQVCEGLSLADLVPFEGADHSFKAGKQEITPGLAEATDTWLHGLLQKPTTD